MEQELEIVAFDRNWAAEGKEDEAVVLDTQMNTEISMLSYTVDNIGDICLAMKSSLKHGYYERWYESKGLTRNQVYYAMRRKRQRDQGALEIIENTENQYFETPEKYESEANEPLYTQVEADEANRVKEAKYLEAVEHIHTLKEHVDELQEKLNQSVKPNTIVKEVDSEVTLNMLRVREQQVKELTRRYENIKKTVEEQQSKRSPMPRMRDLQGETQQRILNDWATTTHVMVMSCNSFLAHVPDAVSRQQFDGDAWQRLSEVKQINVRVAEVIRDIEKTRNGDVVTGSLVIPDDIDSHFVDGTLQVQ